MVLVESDKKNTKTHLHNIGESTLCGISIGWSFFYSCNYDRKTDMYIHITNKNKSQVTCKKCLKFFFNDIQ